MFAGGTNVDMACDFVLHLVHNNAFSAIVVVWAREIFAWVAVAVFVFEVQRCYVSLVWMLSLVGTVLVGWKTLSVPSHILAIQVLSLFCWH